jgi:site-specific recombinase XerD
MKSFESFLSPQLNEYMAYRKGLGYATKSLRGHILIFDRYLRETGVDWNSLQTSFFLEMRANLNMESSGVNKILSTARQFFWFMVRRGYVDENPLEDIPFLKEETVLPFIFSPEQTHRLLCNVYNSIRRTKRYSLIDLGAYIAILLMARCGLRISEPLRLLVKHYRKDDVTLYIEKTKFRKDRLIPIPKAVMRETEDYLSVRKSLLPHDDNPYLLAGRKNKPLTEYQVRSTFRRAVKNIGLDQPRRVIGNMIFNPPTPHSLRHSFAVNTLIAIKKRKESLRRALPVLATFLGHSEYKHTTIYLRVADALSRKNLLDFSLWQRKKT